MCTINLKTILTDGSYAGPLYWSEDTDCACDPSGSITNPDSFSELSAGGFVSATTLDLTGKACGDYTLSYATASDPCVEGCIDCKQVTFTIEPVPEVDCSESMSLCAYESCDTDDKLDIAQEILDATCLVLPDGSSMTRANVVALFGLEDGTLSGTFDQDVTCDGVTEAQTFNGTVTGTGAACIDGPADDDPGYFNPCECGAGTYDLVFTISNPDAVSAPCDDCEVNFTFTVTVTDNPDAGEPVAGLVFCNA